MGNKSEPEVSLNEKIAELESLLDREKSKLNKENKNIPILDDVVTAEDYAKYIEEDKQVKITSSSPYEELAIKLEKKFSSELDELTSAIKGNLKETIIKELKSELRKSTDKNLHQAASPVMEQNVKKND